MNDVPLQQIIALIEKQMGRYKKPITPVTALEKDLGMTGDDAYEFLQEYSAAFGVDISGFEFSKYFLPEGDSVLPILGRFFTGKQNPKQAELTVSHLLKGIEAGRLDEAVISAEETERG